MKTEKEIREKLRQERELEVWELKAEHRLEREYQRGLVDALKWVLDDHKEVKDEN